MKSIQTAVQNLKDQGETQLAEWIDQKSKQLLKQAQEKSQFPLQEILTCRAALQAKIEFSHYAHWISKGENYFADHLLFERIYNESQEDPDPLAEKLIGTLGQESETKLVDPIPTLKISLQILEQFQSEDLPNSLQQISQYLLEQIDSLYHTLEQQNLLSLGLDDFLMQLHDKHETHSYLLQQRLK